MTVIYAKCKHEFDPPRVRVGLYVCDTCWEKVKQQAAEYIRIKMRK